MPDGRGRFGPFGGRYVPETLMPALDELAAEYERAKADTAFASELTRTLAEYAGRPSPITFCPRLTAHCGGARIFFKREDLNHTGSHKINNVMGQGLLTVRMGKKRIIAETGAGQHGVATAVAAARLGLECTVYMGAEDVRRQKLNAYRMKLLGTEVVAVRSGAMTLKDAINEAFRDWMSSVANTHYCIGSVMGPHPFPVMVRDFQSVVGREAIEQMPKLTGRLPDVAMACVGGGSNAAGLFYPLLETDVRLIGVEAAGRGLDTGLHSATLTCGRPGVLHGMSTYVLQDDEGQTANVHSVSAGLDYPGVGPEHSAWKESGRVQYESATDAEALDAFLLTSRLEGIIPALESAHAVAYAMKLAATMPADKTILVNLSGRGDKDCMEVARITGEAEF